MCHSEICTLFLNLYFTCPETSFMFGEQEVRIPSMLLSSLCELKCVVGTSNMAAPISWSASCSQACQKIVLGTPGFEDFDFLIHVAHLRNAKLVIWCYLFVCLFISLRNSWILAHVYFRFIKVNFPFTKGEGKRRKLSFPSTVDNFWDTFWSPWYSFIASYDAKNELKIAQEVTR